MLFGYPETEDGIRRQSLLFFSAGVVLNGIGIILIAWILKILFNGSPQDFSILIFIDTIGLIVLPLGLFLMGYAYLVK
jgi:hypothetical protein